jgi:hypothetical protein
MDLPVAIRVQPFVAKMKKTKHMIDEYSSVGQSSLVKFFDNTKFVMKAAQRKSLEDEGLGVIGSKGNYDRRGGVSRILFCEILMDN